MKANLCKFALLQIVVWLPGLVATGCRSDFNFYIWSSHCPLIYSGSQNQMLAMESPAIYPVFLTLSAFICKTKLVVASTAQDNTV